MAVKHGWAGVLMYGMIRDSHDISTMNLGVKALGTHPQKSQKKGIGEVDIPVHFRGCSFNPGEFLYADHDGIIVSDTALI
jgi:regulator of ribonuclease activity A